MESFEWKREELLQHFQDALDAQRPVHFELWDTELRRNPGGIQDIEGVPATVRSVTGPPEELAVTVLFAVTDFVRDFLSAARERPYTISIQIKQVIPLGGGYFRTDSNPPEFRVISEPKEVNTPQGPRLEVTLEAA